jgi:hypothetical protein
MSQLKNPVTRLIVFRMSQTMTEGKSVGDVLNGIRTNEISDHGSAAKLWVERAILAVRQAPDADPEWTDHDIAQQIIDEIQQNHPRLRI